MPIEIKACDGNIGAIIESQGKLTDKDLIDSLQRHLTHNTEKFQKYKYILIDHTALTKLAISDETVENISELLSDISSINSDAIVAMVTYVSYGASRDLINKISKLHELFIYRSSWETLLFRTKPQAVRWIKERIRDKFGINGLTFD
jgi:hypothetical protein